MIEIHYSDEDTQEDEDYFVFGEPPLLSDFPDEVQDEFISRKRINDFISKSLNDPEAEKLIQRFLKEAADWSAEADRLTREGKLVLAGDCLRRSNELMTAREVYATIPEKIINELRLIDENLFHEVLVKMREEIEAFVGDRKYVVIVEGEDMDDAEKHSNMFVGRSLGIVPSEVEDASKVVFPAADLKNPERIEELKQFVQDGGVVIYADDVSISFSHLSRLMMYLDKQPELNLNNDNFYIGLVASSQEAKDRLSLINAKTFVGLRIPDIVDIFSHMELQFLPRAKFGSSRNYPATLGTVLSFLYYKVPDNVYWALRKFTNSQTWVLNDKPDGGCSIYPHYRDGSVMMYS